MPKKSSNQIFKGNVQQAAKARMAQTKDSKKASPSNNLPVNPGDATKRNRDSTA